MNEVKWALAAAISAAVFAASAQVTTFDATTGLMTIPSVAVGAATYSKVTLRHIGNNVFTLQDAKAQVPAGPGVGSYNVTSNVLTLPAVKVGEATYLDVTLLNAGNFTFNLLTATALPQSVGAELAAVARELEAQFAQAVPANGAARLSLTDACWRSNGRTRSNYIADYDANVITYKQRDAYAIERKVQNVQVLALRNLVHADGSTRREIDVEYDLAYRDGTVQRDQQTLLSGSSSGTPGCATPQTGAGLRGIGNQQLVSTSVRAVNYRDERYALTNGAAVSPAVNYRREIQFNIADPMGNAMYATVTGAGPAATVNGTAVQFSMKLLSPRLTRSAPELAGKSGNFLNWLDDDTFRPCRMANGSVPVVSIVDCAGQGTTSNVWGWTTTTPNAAADQGFADQGWQAGGVYRFDIYNDDGWKTVNGQSGKTPIATYFATLERLPYTFVAMTDKYPLINLGGMSTAQLAANATSATPAALALSWTAPALQADGHLHRLFQVWEFQQGAKVGNASAVFNPAYRTLNRAYPGSTTTATTAFPVSAKLPDQNSKTYTEYNLFFSEPGSFNSIQTRISLQ